MAAAAGRGRTRDKVGHTSVLWRGARVGILFLIIYTVLLLTASGMCVVFNKETKTNNNKGFKALPCGIPLVLI